MLSSFAMSHAACVSLVRNPTSTHLERASFKICPRLNMPIPSCASGRAVQYLLRVCYASHTSRGHRMVLCICDDRLRRQPFSLSRLGSVALTPINSPLYSSALPVKPGGTKAPRYQEEISHVTVRPPKSLSHPTLASRHRATAVATPNKLLLRSCLLG